MRHAKLLMYFFVLLAIATPVLSQTDPFSAILEPFANFNLTKVYERYGVFIDFLAYVVLFINVAMFSLAKMYGQNKAIPVVIGGILGIAATFFAQTAGFKLVALGPFALAIGLIVVGVAVYKLITGLGIGDAGTAAAWGFVLVYGFMLTIAPQIFDWVKEQQTKGGAYALLAIIPAILTLAFFFALIKIITSLVSAFGSGGAGGGVLGRLFGGGGGPLAPGDQPPVVRGKSIPPGAPEDIVKGVRDEQTFLDLIKRANQEIFQRLVEIEKRLQGTKAGEPLPPEQGKQITKDAAALKKAADAAGDASRRVSSDVIRESGKEKGMPPPIPVEAGNRANLANDLRETTENGRQAAGILARAAEAGKPEVIALAADEVQRKVNQAERDRRMMELSGWKLSQDLATFKKQGKVMFREQIKEGPKKMGEGPTGQAREELMRRAGLKKSIAIARAKAPGGGPGKSGGPAAGGGAPGKSK